MAEPRPWTVLGTERACSPDGRLRLDLVPYGDPHSDFEASNFERLELRHAATGAPIATLTGADYEWTAEGGVRFHVLETVVTVAPDLASFTTGVDGATAFRIGELGAWQARRNARLWRELPDPPPPPPLGWLDWLIMAAVVVVALLGLLVIRGDLELPSTSSGERAEAERIDAWAATCPGAGIGLLRLTEDGRLDVPRGFAPAPLPRIDAGQGRALRFGDGRVMIEVSGTEVTWWPDARAPRGMPCRSQAGGTTN